MKDYTMIKSDHDLIVFRNYLSEKQINLLAMDFESESNLHVYGEKLCLIQIYDGKRFFLIDPFEISRDELAKLLEDKRIVKYFYGCDSDLSQVYKQYKIKIKSVLDVKLLVDVLGLEKKGLDAAVSEILNVTVTGKKRYQMHNWTVRPIKQEALEYALTDVEHLFDLYDGLLKRIVEENKYTALLHSIVQNRNEFDSKSVPAVYKSNEYRSFHHKEKVLFDQLYQLRDKYARELNYPPNVVLSKEVLFGIVKKTIELQQIVFDKRVSPKHQREIIGSLKEITGV